jgi:histidinol-phosphatase (PHP family)
VPRSLTEYNNRQQSFYKGRRKTVTADMHVHTQSSPDADIPADELCVMGLAVGVETIGFVAHVDLCPEDHCYMSFSEEQYMRELNIADSSGTRVLRGLEVGEPHLYMQQAEQLFTRSRYDFITGALHWVEDRLVLDEKAFQTGNAIDLVEEYYRNTLAIVQNTNISIVAHMGIFRRGMARAGLSTDIDEVSLFPVLLKKILQTMINKGIALEVNTAGLRGPDKTSYPTEGVLRLYSSLGGQRITIGSDTHRKQNAFFGLSSGMSLVASCGFGRYGVFVAGEYVPTPLL